MSFITNLSLKVRITALVALLLISAITIVSWVGHSRYQASYLHTVDETGNIALRGLTAYLGERYDNVSFELDDHGHLARLVWPGLTPFLQEDAADAIRSIHDIEGTIFRYDRVSEEFTRVATTIMGSDGTRQVGTTLARGAVYDALLEGELFHGDVDVLGQPYRTHYVPVHGLDGNLVGAVASALQMETVLAELRQSVIEKMMISSAIIAVFLAVTFGLIYVLLKPFGRIADSVVGLSEGKLDEEIGYANRGDEVGAISNALLVLQASMQHANDLQTEEVERSKVAAEKQREQQRVVDLISDGLAELSQLNLTTRIENDPNDPFLAEYESLRVSFNELVDRLSESMIAIRLVADEVSGDAREMSGSSNDLSSRTESQAATLQESAAALEELSQSVQSTAENAADAEATTRENRAVAKETGEIVSNAVNAMAAIEASSQQITQIISVIDDIAFQTNLLALNAGVEAARAGEAGRGFAVVASEVRALAQHSSASAQEIKGLIAASSEQVENGSKLVRATGQSLGDIIERVDRVASLVSDIAVSANEQSVGVSEINSGVRDLDAATQRNAAMAEEASAASEGLTNAAERLADHLGRFKIEKSGGSSVVSAPGNWAAAASARAGSPIPQTHAPRVERASNGGATQANVFSGF
jgi:methyl-accepting chemotaxis protein